MSHDLKGIASAFALDGAFVSARPHGSGHIHDTYVLECAGPTRYLLQRINHRVFRDVPALMGNIACVCDHARRRLEAEGVGDADRRVLTLIPTRAGEPFHRDGAGSYWRVYRLIEGARSYDIAESPQHARRAARAYGAFQKRLADLPADRLVATIRDFHHTPRRFAAFESAVAAGSHQRVAEARREIDWLHDHRELTGALIRLREDGRVIERIAHHDTKLGNVLFDEQTHEAICVVDLDTVMPGLSLYDFGDLVRTSTSPVAEDEPDPSKVTMRMPMFEALAGGYLQEAGAFLTPAEVRALPTSAVVLTLTMAIRFLTDFLRGDVYYKTAHPLHNLHRCRTQIALIESMQAQAQAMAACVEAAARRAPRDPA